MDEDGAGAVAARLAPLLRALEMLSFIARHLHPPDLEDLLASVGAPDEGLREARVRQGEWPERLSPIGTALDAASDATLEAYAELRRTLGSSGDVRAAYRALRLATVALEALYPLAGVLPPVSSFFIDPALQSDETLQHRLLEAPARSDTGVLRFDADSGERGGFWVYVPEHYTPDRAWPLVMALHGGSGTGRTFLWSWLRDVRSRGAILVAPTSIGSTWALLGDDPDTDNLARILERVRASWTIDPARLLLTGMSDGGTFTYVSGLEAGSPFTHLAPVAAAFHPMLVQMADAGRVRGLPIHIVHGVLDWMFPIALARQAHAAFRRAGADVTYREVPDLSHTYPREMNATLLSWLETTPSPRR